jgi:hypothetical protein
MPTKPSPSPREKAAGQIHHKLTFASAHVEGAMWIIENGELGPQPDLYRLLDRADLAVRKAKRKAQAIEKLEADG